MRTYACMYMCMYLVLCVSLCMRVYVYVCVLGLKMSGLGRDQGGIADAGHGDTWRHDILGARGERRDMQTAQK